MTFTRAADSPGVKLGKGPGGGVNTFGKDRAENKRDGIISQYVLCLVSELAGAALTVLADSCPSCRHRGMLS
jgi:hypothetical protein